MKMSRATAEPSPMVNTYWSGAVSNEGARRPEVTDSVLRHELCVALQSDPVVALRQGERSEWAQRLTFLPSRLGVKGERQVLSRIIMSRTHLARRLIHDLRSGSC